MEVSNDNIIREILKEEGRDKGLDPVKPAEPATPPKGEEKPPKGEEKPAPATPPKGEEKPAKPAEKPVDDADEDIDDERLRRYLKKKGIEVDKIEDLKKPKESDKPQTDEEKAEQKKQFRENAIKFALNKEGSTIKTSDISAYENDLAKTAREIVYPIVIAKWKAEDKDLTQEQLDERFTEFYAEDKDENDWGRKERMELMKSQAQYYLNKKHEKVLGLESEYESHIQTLDNATAYNKQVENVLSAFSKDTNFEFEVEFEGGVKEKDNYKYEFSKEDIDEVREHLLSKESFAKLGAGQVSDELLSTMVKSILVNKKLDDIVKSVARSYGNKMVLAEKAGRKGIPTHDGGGTRQENAPPKESLIGDLLKENNR